MNSTSGSRRDDEWAFVAPYLSLIAPDALQRKHDLREVDNGLRWLAPDGRAVAHAAARLPALASGLSADAALAAGRLFRGHRP